MFNRFIKICEEKAINNPLSNPSTSHCAAIIKNKKIIAISTNKYGGNNIEFNIDKYCTTHAESAAINNAIKKNLIPPLKGI